MSAYRIYCARPGEEAGACAYYRMILPLTTMVKLGCPIEPMFDHGSSTITPHRRAAMFMESDISLIYQSISAATNTQIDATQNFKPMRDNEGDIRYPPTFIADTDDDLFNVMPLNITFGNIGIKHPVTRELLKPGDEISISHPVEIATEDVQAILNDLQPNAVPGTRADHAKTRYVFDGDGKWHYAVDIWKDGVNMDIEQNQRCLNNWRETLGRANMVTCSTPRVEAAVLREVPTARTFVSPNAIDFDDYPQIELRDHPDEVRILWEGSTSHQEGLWPLNESFARVAAKYPHTKWVFFGSTYKWAARNIPAGRVSMIPWVPYDAYKTRLSTIGHDISIAPLAPNLFNDSRSAIRWYENSVICRPAATLAQNWAAYRDEIIEGETGLLFNDPAEFETKLGGLIEDAALRAKLARNSVEWIHEHRDARKVIGRLFQKYVEVREGHKLTMPKYIDDIHNPTNPGIVL